MKISSKGRYGLAAMISMAQKYHFGEYITIVSIAEGLGISKIYLEQVFSQLKRAGLVNSVKGAQGGYQLSKSPDRITALDVLRALENSMFEVTEKSVEENAHSIELAMRSLVFAPIDQVVEECLEKVSLYDLMQEADKQSPEQDYMFFI